MKCLACGDHPLNYIHCDRWDCPLLVLRAKIEVRELGSDIHWGATVTLPIKALIPDWEDEEQLEPEPPEEDDEHLDQDDPA